MAHLLKGVTSDHELIELARLLNVRINRILALPEIAHPLPKKGTYLILLRTTGGVGHWTAIHNGEYFDSMGQGAPRILGPLPYSEVQYQGARSDHCGVWCMLWLYAKQHNRMGLLKGFHDHDVDVI